MIKLAEQFVPVKIDADKDASTKKKFRVYSLPTIIFVDGQGDLVGKIRGYRPPEAFAQEMEKIARLHRDLPELESKFEADPTDAVTGAALASLYAFRGDATKAKRIIKSVEEAGADQAGPALIEAYMALGECYDGKEDFDKAGKYYAKVVEASTDGSVISEARYNAALAYFRDQTKLEPGHRSVGKRLKEAHDQLTPLLAMAGLPKDQQEQAAELMKAINERQAEHEKRVAEEKKGDRGKGR